jgi:hypothetical protein
MPRKPTGENSHSPPPTSDSAKVLSGHWSIDRAPSRTGPWRYVRSLQGDLWTAIRAGHEAREGESWLRLVPKGRVERAILVRS